jgi:hypothetical protein
VQRTHKNGTDNVGRLRLISLHIFVEVDMDANVSENRAASIFRVEVRDQRDVYTAFLKVLDV